MRLCDNSPSQGPVTLLDPFIFLTPTGGIVSTMDITGNATIVIDLTQRPKNGTVIPVLTGASFNATYTVVLKYPSNACQRYTSSEEQTPAGMNAVILVDSSRCQRSGLSKKAVIGVVLGAIAGALLVFLLLLLAFAFRRRVPALNALFSVRRQRQNTTLYV